MTNEDQLGHGPAIPPQVEKKAERAVKHARKATEDVGSAAGAMAKEYRGKAEQAWDEVQDRVRTFREDADNYVRENPTKAVFTAVGIGFVLGLMFRR
jgi:ElaB/YqjD/DUF883 family membrane-anchored ribosome-binding protein